MDPWTEGIRRLLALAPTGAMALSRLLDGLREEGIATEGREQWILKRLGEQQERFRIIPDLRRPWEEWPRTEARQRQPPAGSPGGDPWILPLAERAPSREGDHPIRHIRESLRAWGEAVDEGSSVAVARWVRANQEAERTCRQLATRTSAL